MTNIITRAAAALRAAFTVDPAKVAAQIPASTQVKVTILVPSADNDGKAFGPATFAWFESQMKAIGGAFTRTTNVTGVWSNDAGKVYRDVNRVYFAVVDADQVDAFRTLARKAAEHFRQECIYLEVAPVTVEFVTK